ncbi:hypothetical protein ACFLZJ_00900 [Nanoarchaeota archaeon]
MLNKKPIKEKRVLAVSQIIVLIMGLFAFAYAIGGGIGFVSAEKVLGTEDTEDLVTDPNTDLKWGDVLKGWLAPKWPGRKGGKEAVKAAGTKTPFIEKFNKFAEKPLGQFVGDALASYAIYSMLKFGLEALGVNSEDAEAFAKSAGWGYFYSQVIAPAIGLGPWSVVFVTFAVLAGVWKEKKTKIKTFECLPWQAPLGGDYCEECNKQGIIPCTKYQCESLGQGCELINEGTTETLCTWISRNDRDPPIIRPWKEVLTEDYAYSNPDAKSPPDRGVEILHNQGDDKCSPAFTPFEFGVTLDEPAKCKYDFVRQPDFDNMAGYFNGSSTDKYNHSQAFSIPGTANLAAEDIPVDNGGQYDLQVRCRDSNGNYNLAEFSFKFCIEEGPDTIEPIIVGTDVLNGAPIPYDLKKIGITAYVNEPAECKWSRFDQDYKDMENSFACSESIFESNAQMLYPCKGTLDGLQNLVENKFYFKCRDQPALKGTSGESLRNTNEEPYIFTLMGTRPLILDWVKPNGTIAGSTDPIKVTLEAQTSAGYNEGEALCYYSDNGREGNYFAFFNTNSHQHSMDLWLSEGDYSYYIRCLDLGGNFAEDTVEFTVDLDTTAPTIVRAYHEGNHLKLITDEEATCVYSNDDCNFLFEDGIGFADVEGTEHFTDWNTKKDFYVRCEDQYQNRPFSECSMIVRPFELYETSSGE